MSSSPRESRLPNGLDVFSLNKANLALVYEDVFLRDQYLQHGIEVHDGDCVFDVGANVGLFLLRVNQALGRGRVFCFEPIGDIFKALEKNSRRHNHLDVQLLNCGLSDRSGTAVFSFVPKQPSDSSMYQAADSESVRQHQRDYILNVLEGRTPIRLGWPARFGIWMVDWRLRRHLAAIIRWTVFRRRSVKCQLTTLSDVIREHAVDRIDLLKMDAEFAEFDILAGLTAADWPRVRQVAVEVHGGEATALRMRDLLAAHGFSVELEIDPSRPHNTMCYARRPSSPSV